MSQSMDDGLKEVEIIECGVTLDSSDVVEPDSDPPQQMGDPSVAVTEENREAALLSKSMAMDAILEGNLNAAIDHLTAAIVLNPKSAMLYASRGTVFVKLKKPNAAIRDADVALKMNDELVKGYKARGMANVQLGLWEEAAKDLRISSKLDFDEETAMMLKKVELNVKKIEEHRMKNEKLQKAFQQRKAELEKKRKMKEANDEFASMLKDGQVICIDSSSDFKIRMNAASKLSRLAIIYFTASWCGPCSHLGPMYTTLASKYPKAVFLKVDVDKACELTAERISSIPSFYLFKNGAEVDEQLDTSMNSLENKIIKHYAESS